MAWIVVDLDDTLVSDQEEPPEEMVPGAEPGQPVPTAVEGAVEAMTQLASEGHRLSVYTSRFAPMPDSERQRLKEQIEQELVSLGFPPMEVWSGTSKPSADIFIDNKAVTFDGDWGLALAQAQMMLEERGLVPGPQPDDGTMPPEDPNAPQAPPEDQAIEE